MLKLTRKAGEPIIIGEDIIITVVSAEGGRARLSIEAPADVPIKRDNLRRVEKQQDTEL